jgi:hypothetical protein
LSGFYRVEVRVLSGASRNNERPPKADSQAVRRAQRVPM